MADVYKIDIDKIRQGYNAVITTLSYPNHPFTGKIDKVLNTPEQPSPFKQIRLTVDNKGYLLKPKMFASITINLKSNKQKPAVPA